MCKATTQHNPQPRPQPHQLQVPFELVFSLHSHPPLAPSPPRSLCRRTHAWAHGPNGFFAGKFADRACCRFCEARRVACGLGRRRLKAAGAHARAHPRALPFLGSPPWPPHEYRPAEFQRRQPRFCRVTPSFARLAVAQFPCLLNLQRRGTPAPPRWNAAFTAHSGAGHGGAPPHCTSRLRARPWPLACE